MNGRTLLILVCSWLFHANPVGAKVNRFDYQPFPVIPTLAVEQDSLVKDSVEACASFDVNCVDSPDSAFCRTPEGATAPEAESIPKLLERAREDPASRDRLLAATAALRETCRAIHLGRALTQPQLDMLRALVGQASFRRFVASLRQEPAAIQAAAGVASAVVAQPGRAGASTPRTFGTFEGSLVQGLFDFLARRARLEALAYLSDELRKQLCDDEGRLLFPATCTVVDSLNASQSLGSIGAVFRAAVEMDLRRLPDVWLAYVELKQPERSRWTFGARLGFAYANALGGQRDPVDIARSIGALPQQACEVGRAGDCRALASLARQASALVYAVTQAGPDWPDFYRSLQTARARAVATVALVLLAEKRCKQTDANAKPFGLEGVNRIIASPSYPWQGILELEETWTKAVARAQSADPLVRQREFLAASQLSFDKLGETILAVVVLTDSRADAAAIIGNGRQLVLVYGELVEKRYGAAVVRLGLSVRALGAELGVREKWEVHLALLVEIGEARSSVDVSAALESYAEPLDSHKTKHRTSRLMINGFVGGWGGIERISARGVRGTAFAASAFAPVGFHASRPLWRKGLDSPFHVGLLLTVLDLGAMTTYRFGSTTLQGDMPTQAGTGTEPRTDRSAQVGLEQVLLPGAFITVGLFGSPFVLGVGASLSPKLRRVSQNGA